MDERRDSENRTDRRPAVSDTRPGTAADTRPGTPADTRPGTPADTRPGTPAGTLSVDTLLAVVRAGTEAGSEGETRAMAAFRAARDKGARTARTRRRDDWRPNAWRRVQLSIRTTLAVLLASLTLGGVAFAAIGSAARDDGGAGGGHGGQDGRPRTKDSAPTRSGPSDDPGAPGTGSASDDRSAGPRETEAHCDACGQKDEGQGQATGSRVDEADKARKAGGGDRPADKPAPPSKPAPANKSTPANKGTPSSEPKPSKEPSEQGRSTVSNEPGRSGSSGGEAGRSSAPGGTK